MYVGAGGMLEKCVSAKFGSKSVDEPKVQWSVAGAVGAQYRLGNYVGLYFEPEVSHYFTETTLRTSLHRFFPVADPPSRSAPFILTFN